MAAVKQGLSWSEARAGRARQGVGAGLADILALANATDIISFAGGFPDPRTFPGEVLVDLFAELVRSDDHSAMQYSPTGGLPGPRGFIRERLARLEGQEPADPELIVTSGAIEALELIGKSFLDPGDIVVVEAPTYLGAIMAFRSFEASVVGVPMDDEGMRVDRLAALLASGAQPKLLYTIPDHQNPAGVSLSPSRRDALLGLARRHGILVVEDVAYRELAFDGIRLPSLWSLGPDVVVQAGTFSKTFFPGVRLGWGVGPPEVVAQLVLAKQNTDQCAGALGQRLLEEYGRRGLLEEQNRRARRLYQRRCSLLMSALEEHMPDRVKWTRPRGGFFSWVTLPPDLDSVALSRAAAAVGVAFVPGVHFFPDGSRRNHLRLAFSSVDDELIEEGARRLGALFKRELRAT
jgi:2-aminoadipate transaminase